MDKIYIYEKKCTIPPSVSVEKSFLKSCGAYKLDSGDIDCYCLDMKFGRNEKIARELLGNVARTLEFISGKEEIPSEQLGISFGTSQGCILSLKDAAAGIKAKGGKGMKPKDSTNCIISGAASKVAIALGMKGFNLTNYDGCCAGIDAVIFACDMLSFGNCSFAIACAGEETSGVYASLMLGKDNAFCCGKDILFSIDGYSKGLVYGDDRSSQVEFLINRALNSCGGITDEEKFSVIYIHDSSDADYSDMIRCLFASKVVNFTSEKISDEISSTSGILAIIAASAASSEPFVIIQSDSAGYFSCIIIRKNSKKG